MRLPRFHTDWLLPLTLVAFVGPAIQYLSVVFSPNSRWAALALLVLVLAIRNRLHRALTGGVGLALGAYLIWCALTITWSENFELSWMKVIAMGAVSAGMLAAGRLWVVRRGPADAFAYQVPLAVVALLTGVLGGGGEGTTVEMGPIDLYQGLSGNPNMLGSILMMSLPVVLWMMYSRWGRMPERWLWLAVVALVLLLLGLANSRAAILGSICIGLAFLVALPLRHRVGVISAVVVGIVALFLAKPELIAQAEHRYVYKGSDEEGILYTRERVWEESFELAKEGGLVGAGYGVTIGAGSFQGGLSAVGYGREKGNSQLAIWEETGLVGLALYGVLLFALFLELARGMRYARGAADRVMLLLLIGALVGICVMSVFEAWWVAPGSPEAVWFWATAGVALEVARQFQAKARAEVLAPRAASTLMPGMRAR